jgi:hypothetical protein
MRECLQESAVCTFASLSDGFRFLAAAAALTCISTRHLPLPAKRSDSQTSNPRFHRQSCRILTQPALRPHACTAPTLNPSVVLPQACLCSNSSGRSSSSSRRSSRHHSTDRRPTVPTTSCETLADGERCTLSPSLPPSHSRETPAGAAAETHRSC